MALRAEPDLHWTCNVPLVTNPVVLRQAVFTFMLAGVIVTSLLAVAFWSTGSLDTLPAVAGIIFAICGALIVTGLLGAGLIYGNRMAMRFRVSGAGVATEVIDRRARRVAVATTLLGLASGKPGAAGSGLLAMANSRVESRWRGIRSARFDARRHIIELRNGWRTVMVLFCTAENYGAVADFVRRHIGDQAQPKWTARPPVRGLMWSLAVVLASLPSFAMPWPFEADLLAAMMLLCFGVACVWFLPPLAWALLAAIAWVSVTILATALETTRSSFVQRPPFPAYTIASEDDWLMLGIEVAALAFLAWFAWRCLTGRFTPVLMGDLSDMEGE